jgi:Protein of unknown function (DUF3987)
MDAHPQTHCGDLANPPPGLSPLCLRDHWVIWKWQPAENGKWTKPPYCADSPSRLAANNNPQTWATHHSAVSAVSAGCADGVGFVLTNTNVGAIDLDHCRNSQTGAIDAWAQAILDRAPIAYREITVSGEGLRIIGVTKGQPVHRKFTIAEGSKGAAVEVYRSATRYITISGLQIGECTELPNIDAIVDDIVVQHGSGNGHDAKGFGFDFDIDELIRKGAPEGQRSEAFARVVWSLAGQGFTLDDIEQELRRYPNGIAAKFINRLRPEIERCYGKRQRTQHQQQASEPKWDDPDWSILEDRRGELPEFPTGVFAEPMEQWLERAARGAGVHSDHVAIPLLAVASSLIGTARRVCASRSWTEPMTLWTALIAASGDRKTPGMNVSVRALSLIEKDSEASIRAARLAHETRAQAAKEAAKKWKDDRQAALDANPPRDPPPMPLNAIDPGNFIEPRLYATDPTIERLAALLQVRPRGMLLIRDELSGLFANMRRYSGGSDRPFWLESWCGGRHVVERVSGAVVIPYLLVGVTGGFQPDKLARSFAGDEDGMYGRFLYGWPGTPDYQPLTNDVSEVEPEIQNALKALIRLPAEDADGVFATQVIPLSEGAIRQFEEYRRAVDSMKRALDGRERQWLVKSESQVLRLAGTLAYLAWGFSLGQPSSNGIQGICMNLEPDTIEEVFMINAIRLVREYLWPHARAAMRQIGLTDRHADARRALRWIRAHKRTEVSLKDIRREALNQILDAEQTQELLAALVQAGWLRETTTPTAGRALRRWEVNPKLFADGGAGSAGSAESP